jgi:diphthine synthase
MLFLVGVGLDCKDLSLKAVEACKRCELFFDRYTCVVSERQLALVRRLSGRKPRELGRQELEEGAKEIVARAKSADVAVLVGGDPLIATTHKILFIEARRQHVKVGVVHSASVVSAAIGESGLDFYRFGRVATIPRWSEHYRPVSFYEAVRDNMKSNLHSLMMLDYKKEEATSLSVKEAVETLERAEESYRSGIISNGTKIVILNRVSSSRARSVFTSVGSAKRLKLDGPSVIIIPAALSDIERESVACMCRSVK